MSHVLYIGSDTLIRLTDVVDNVTGLPLTDATAQAVLLSDSTSLASPITFAPDGTNSNDYYAIVPHEVTGQLEEDTEYTLAVTLWKGQSQLYQEIAAIGRVKQP
jgi:hypothetical protein